jgi:molybdate transport system ATP-binding protein
VDEVLQLADDMVLMKSGKSAVAGKMHEVIQSSEFQEAIGRQEAFSVASMVIKSHDPSDGLTLLQGSAANLRVPRMSSAVGEVVRLRIRARDVAIALNPPSKISFQSSARDEGFARFPPAS